MSLPTTSSDPNLLLAMDTSGDVCSIAIFRGGRLAIELAFRHEMHLSERLVAHLDSLRRETGVVLADFDYLVVGIGPGSFTGTRIGVMTMKTFAFLQSTPLLAFNSLETMAAEYCGLAEPVIIPVLPCRSGMVYACPYSTAGGVPVPLAEPGAVTFSELGEILKGIGRRVNLFCGSAAERYAPELRSQLLQHGLEAEFGAIEFPRASALGLIARHKLADGLVPGPALDVVPLYISPPPITLPKKPIPT